MTLAGQPQKPWSVKDTATLHAKVAEGLTFGQIAKILDGQYSRSAVIGKAKRLGLKSQSGKNKSSPRSAQSPAPSKPAKMSNATPRIKYSGKRPVRLIGGVDVVQLGGGDKHGNGPDRDIPRRICDGFDPLPGTVPVPFGAPGCKWPVDGMSGKGLLVCGGTRAETGPYCEAHQRLSYQPRIRKVA